MKEYSAAWPLDFFSVWNEREKPWRPFRDRLSSKDYGLLSFFFFIVYERSFVVRAWTFCLCIWITHWARHSEAGGLFSIWSMAPPLPTSTVISVIWLPLTSSISSSYLITCSQLGHVKPLHCHVIIHKKYRYFPKITGIIYSILICGSFVAVGLGNHALTKSQEERTVFFKF